MCNTVLSTFAETKDSRLTGPDSARVNKISVHAPKLATTDLNPFSFIQGKEIESLTEELKYLHGISVIKAHRFATTVSIEVQ